MLSDGKKRQIYEDRACAPEHVAKQSDKNDKR